MTYLVVGLDHHTLTPWTRHILAGDVRTAIRTARSRAAAEGVALAVAAVIGPNSTLLHGGRREPPEPRLPSGMVRRNAGSSEETDGTAVRPRGA